jgi:hypothetical protein
MNKLKSRLPGQNKDSDIDAFISGAEERTTAKSTIADKNISFPWEEPGVREDVTKVFNLRLPETYLLKLKYIAENTPESMQKFCQNVMQEAIDAKIDELTK